MSFTRKSIHHTDRIGLDLIELRERLGWDRKIASQKTKLTESFLRALEEEDWKEIGDPMYAERMLRAYVKLLGGNESYFIEKYRHQLKECSIKRRGDECIPRPSRVRFMDLTVASRFLALGGFLVFVLLLGGYVYRQAWAISAPPPVTVDSPEEGQKMEQPLVEVRGKTLSESRVSINGRDAVVQPDGIFHTTLEITRGTTVVVISARKRNGDETTVTRHIVYDRPLPTIGVSTTVLAR